MAISAKDRTLDKLERELEEVRRSIVCNDHIARKYQRRIDAGRKGLTGYRDSFLVMLKADRKTHRALRNQLVAAGRAIPKL